MMNHSIHSDGYIILKNILTKEQLQKGLNSDKNGIIDYKLLKQYIDTIFMPSIVSNTDFIKNPTYIKFRYSNNNNSTDASTFHSDIYNYTKDEIIPIYSCLCYFDKTQLEIIPGSHTKKFHKENTSISSFQKKITVTIEPGDIVIFHANMYHRGTNFNTSGNRRLLQVFEVFPDDVTLKKYYDKLLTVITSNTTSSTIVNSLSYAISKIPMIIDNISFLHYFLVYNDLQYKIILNDIAPWDKSDKLITYEPGKRMLYEKNTGKDPMNVNIICKDSLTTVPGYFYIFIFYFIVFFIIYYVVSKRKYTIKTSMNRRKSRKSK